MRINVLFIVTLSFLVYVESLPTKPTLNFESIFNFGDSLSDTGNFLISTGAYVPNIGRPPYGQTFFNRSTGRCSDGRLIIDFIEEGAVTLMVPGNFPIGCSAVLLERFNDNNKWLYDSRNQCYKPLNNVAKLHNDMLKKGLESLRLKYPHAKIMYADYYSSAMQFFNSPAKYGFTGSVLKACCGEKDGRYNAKPNVRCGEKGSTTCEYPSTYANWDGIHLTEAAYRHIATGLISGRFTIPSFRKNKGFTPISEPKSK
ncbi:hypothetical protein CARUB_v10028062mg [Capsella rubella]|uniref:Uncharacterized protein n=1 Tax=Capsella rubella TaxID=81985 RepID=R0GQY2_9BRAS|nr:hypothetical protein CARUB_v10028062mg [Capsella rubella]